jgi:hypothetical protein
MNEALAIAAVTATLKSLLENAVIPPAVSAGVGDVLVSTLPPDRIALGTEERSQLNLYLYRVSPNSAWQKVTLSSLQSTGDGASTRRPLALDLHYLLTVYGERDLQPETLFGYAVQALHEAPVLTGDSLRTALAVPGLESHPIGTGMLALLADSDVIDRINQVTIQPEFLSLEELSRLWSALQARCRLSATYEASVVWLGSREVVADGRRAAPQVTLDEISGAR